jgi:iron complex outermembrane receptor protein
MKIITRPLLLAPILLSGAGIAAAQDATSAGEIVVTAQKRSEQLEDVPISVSAFTAEFREETGIISTQDQMNFTPGVTYSATADRVAIRGVGRQTNTVGTDPGVAIYNDGFYQPSLLDVGGSTLGTQRVEVLRGPQGTLYGRNSIGGAINVISKRPSDEFEGEARLGYNEYGRTTLEGLVSGPFSDSVRGSLQVFKADQDEGYYENRFPNMPDEGGVVDIWYAEGQLAFEVTDRFDARMRLRVGAYDNRDRNSAMISPYDAGYSLENVPTPTWDLGPGQLNIPNPGLTDNSAFLSDRARSNYLDDYVLFITELNYRFDTFDVKYIGGYQQAETGYSVHGEQGPSFGFDWPLSNDWYNYALFP